MSPWFTLLGTVVGGLIGIASTLLAERGRFKREITKLDRESRRQLYADFLTADAAAHEDMRGHAYAPAQHKAERDELRAAVNDAFADSQLYPARWKMTVLAPPEVVANSEDAFFALRRIRNVLATGHSLESDPYREAHSEHENALRKLRESMRNELGNPPLEPAAESGE